METELARLNGDIAQKNRMIVALKQEREELTTAYRALLQQAYRHRDKKLWIMHVLSSESAAQAYRRWRYFRNYSDYMRMQEKKIRQTEEQLQSEETRLVALHQERVVARDRLAVEIDRMERDQRTLDDNIRKLRQNEKQLRDELQKRIREQRSLDRQIREALAALEKKDAARDSEAIEAARVLSADFAANKGNLPWPLKGAIVLERFGRITDSRWGFTFDNKGVTLSGTKGGDVSAVFNGTVASVWMDNRDSYLIRILVTHGEYSTIYCHMVDVVVKEGDKVVTGQKLGTLSPLGEGNSYFQLLRNGVPSTRLTGADKFPYHRSIGYITFIRRMHRCEITKEIQQPDGFRIGFGHGEYGAEAVRHAISAQPVHRAGRVEHNVCFFLKEICSFALRS